MFDKIRYRLVWNRKGQLNGDGRALVQMECLLQGRRVYFSTKVYLESGQWDGHYVCRSQRHYRHGIVRSVRQVGGGT